jgi:hypothetical protein
MVGQFLCHYNPQGFVGRQQAWLWTQGLLSSALFGVGGTILLRP